jgi:hypothetical protein
MVEAWHAARSPRGCQGPSRSNDARQLIGLIEVMPAYREMRVTSHLPEAESSTVAAEASHIRRSGAFSVDSRTISYWSG